MMAVAIPAPARARFRPRPEWLASTCSRFLAALKDRPELPVRLLQFGCRIGARECGCDGSADEVAELSDRNDDGEAELADLCGIDHRLQPLLRELDALADFKIAEHRIAERDAAARLQQPRALLLRDRPLAKQVSGFLVLARRGNAEPVAIGRRILSLGSGRHHGIADLADDARSIRVFQR